MCDVVAHVCIEAEFWFKFLRTVVGKKILFCEGKAAEAVGLNRDVAAMARVIRGTRFFECWTFCNFSLQRAGRTKDRV